MNSTFTSHETLLLITRKHVQHEQHIHIARNVVVDHQETRTTWTAHSHRTKRCCWSPGDTYNMNSTFTSHETLLLITRKHVQHEQHIHFARNVVVDHQEARTPWTAHSHRTKRCWWPPGNTYNMNSTFTSHETLLLITRRHVQHEQHIHIARNVVVDHQEARTTWTAHSLRTKRCCWSPGNTYNMNSTFTSHETLLVTTRKHVQHEQHIHFARNVVVDHQEARTTWTARSLRTKRCCWSPGNTYTMNSTFTSHETLLVTTRKHVQHEQHIHIARNVVGDNQETRTTWTAHSHRTKRCCWSPAGDIYDGTLESHETLLLANRKHVRQYTRITRNVVVDQQETRTTAHETLLLTNKKHVRQYTRITGNSAMDQQETRINSTHEVRYTKCATYMPRASPLSARISFRSLRTTPPSTTTVQFSLSTCRPYRGYISWSVIRDTPLTILIYLLTLFWFTYLVCHSCLVYHADDNWNCSLTVRSINRFALIRFASEVVSKNASFCKSYLIIQYYTAHG